MKRKTLKNCDYYAKVKLTPRGKIYRVLTDSKNGFMLQNEDGTIIHKDKNTDVYVLID